MHIMYGDKLQWQTWGGLKYASKLIKERMNTSQRFKIKTETLGN